MNDAPPDDDAPPTGPLHFLHYMSERWEERATLASRYFTDTRHHDDPAAWDAQADLDAAFALDEPDLECARPRPGRVLEIGCGPGRLLSRIAPLYDQAVGVDVAPTMLANARRACTDHDRVLLVRGRGHDLAFLRNDAFDLVVMYAVAIHVPIDVATSYLHEARRVLRPGGRVRFTLCRTPDARDRTLMQPFVEYESGRVPGALGHLVTGDDWNGHAFDRDEVNALLASLDFSSTNVRRLNPATWLAEGRR